MINQEDELDEDSQEGGFEQNGGFGYDEDGNYDDFESDIFI